MNQHLHILHLYPDTDDEKINKVAEDRFEYLMNQLDEQGITDYTIIRGFYNKEKPRMAIMQGFKLIVQLAKDNNFENVIIAEDDIKFTHPDSFKYFLEQLELNKDADIFLSMIYQGEINEGNRITNGFSGMTLFSVHNSFYDFFLSLPDDEYTDRKLGDTAFQHKYFVCPKFCCTQRGSYSYHKRQAIDYSPLLSGRVMFTGDIT